MTELLYALAAGHNVAQGSLIPIYTIVPANDEAFDPPKGFPLYDDGILKYDGLGGIRIQGYAVAPWFWTRMTYRQYWHLRTTYCAGGLSGLVTIYTPLGGNMDTFTRMNATMHLKPPGKMDSEYRYRNVQIDFTRLSTPT